MLNIIVLIAYISFFNIVYIGKLDTVGNLGTIGNRSNLGNLSTLGNTSNLGSQSRAEITKEVPLLSNKKAIRSKYCNFKCDCFFSHSVKNDNICVPIWIKPLGL
jgi:hypothetical protein